MFPPRSYRRDTAVGKEARHAIGRSNSISSTAYELRTIVYEPPFVVMVCVKTAAACGYPQYRLIAVGIQHIEVVGAYMSVVGCTPFLLKQAVAGVCSVRIAKEVKPVVGTYPQLSVVVNGESSDTVRRQSMLRIIIRERGW